MPKTLSAAYPFSATTVPLCLSTSLSCCRPLYLTTASRCRPQTVITHRRPPQGEHSMRQWQQRQRQWQWRWRRQRGWQQRRQRKGGGHIDTRTNQLKAAAEAAAAEILVAIVMAMATVTVTAVMMRMTMAAAASTTAASATATAFTMAAAVTVTAGATDYNHFLKRQKKWRRMRLGWRRRQQQRQWQQQWWWRRQPWTPWLSWSVMASGARMGVSDKFRGERTRKGGGVYYLTCRPSPLWGLKKTRQEVKKTTEWFFGWRTLWHIKYLRKTCLFISESAWENAIAFFQLYSWMNFFQEVWQQIIWKWWSFLMWCLMFDFHFFLLGALRHPLMPVVMAYLFVLFLC